jgi:4-diphosphocytidyl-2-C-methyl-D-erythritol kinase
MNESKIKSHAKINLSLYVLGRLKSKLHKIESLITFIELHDEISIKKTNRKFHTIKFYGKFSKGIPKNNTISNLLKFLESKKLLKEKKYSLFIKKNIPQKSGMGGGSMNAASILKYFIKKKIIKLKKNEIEKVTDFIGSDVKLGLENRSLILNASGKVQRIKQYKKLYVLIAKPNFGCSTKVIYSGLKNYSELSFRKKNNFRIKNLKMLKNDLELVAIKKYPLLLKLKKTLNYLPNVIFVRMTGSGSAFVAYFISKKAAINASKVFKSESNNYWITISKTI